jgi:hypothetical protein
MARLLRMTIVAILLAASARPRTVGSFPWRRLRAQSLPPRYPTATSFDGGFNFCRLMYAERPPRRRRIRWSTDYWDADINFTTASAS